MLGLEKGRQGVGSDCGGWEVWSSLEGAAWGGGRRGDPLSCAQCSSVLF